MAGEKRRRKKVRTNDASWSSSSEDEMEIDNSKEIVQREDEISELSDSDFSQPSDEEPSHQEENPRTLIHKAPAAPASEDFNQFLLNMVTSEFGDDLEALRKANDFGPGSIELLISGLKQGVNIFSPEQRKMLLADK
ncbi:Ribosome assembly protein 3 [Wickerhamiella sorbophila]|uniref:Ribosome assembly protein 3 n=1 Tax=Wickerhamiella sorbophila TaxID=45607 RepID=A0A2T0FBU6_9ASCO|nr:Ribosome assembly protein 3 [Wickerhamiella sorbophila]PRT52482.1 Ribosome assembly protein 3 [Wickerhamiella sorbophila]